MKKFLHQALGLAIIGLAAVVIFGGKSEPPAENAVTAAPAPASTLARIAPEPPEPPPVPVPLSNDVYRAKLLADMAEQFDVVSNYKGMEGGAHQLALLISSFRPDEARSVSATVCQTAKEMRGSYREPLTVAVHIFGGNGPAAVCTVQPNAIP